MPSVDISVKVLGPILVKVDGRPVAGFRSHKTLALLAYLVVERRAVARNYLAELLWPDATTTDGRGHLRRALHDLSQKLPGALVVDYYTAQFNPDLLARTDLALFESLRLQPDGPALEQATALCRGQLLEGVMLDDCSVYETWLAVEREAWLSKATAVLEELFRRHMAMPRFDLALQLAWQLLRLDPWHEDSYFRVMLLLIRNGALAQAVKVYRSYRRALVKELSLEPSDEIEALYTRIQQTRSRRPGNIPHSLTPVVGRTGELATLAQNLADPTCRLLTLTGVSGIGKTRLAIEAAARANSSTGHLFLDGAFLVRLDAVTTPAHFLANTAQALGMTSTAGNVPLSRVLARIEGREILLVLDGFDQLIAHRAVLLTLLEASPKLKLLVTCQERLRLPAEWTLPLKGLAHTADEAGVAPAALNLFQVSIQFHGRDSLSAEEVAIAARVCRLVQGIPLAIELAAAWMSNGSFRRSADALERNLDVLLRGEGQSARHSSLRAALAPVWERLRAEEREALRSPVLA